MLVPYRKEHVPHYHEWMQDPALQEATASEPLSLEEEYEMQRDWADDPNKCTFILLDPSLPDTPGTGSSGGGMCGDVNLFLHPDDDEAEVSGQEQQPPQQQQESGLTRAEVSVMVAEPRSRRKGIAEEVLRIVMAYAVSCLGILVFEAKIGFDNDASLHLFAKLGYREIRRVDVFKEVTVEYRPDEHALAKLRAYYGGLTVARYDMDSE